LVSLVVWEWFYKNPVIEVRLFRNLNFLAANGMMFILGLMLFASLVMMPLFLQSLLGYTAESAGLVLSGGGLLLLFMMPMIGVLSSKVQARYLIAFGWFALSIGMYYSSRQLNLGISFRSASMIRLVQVFGLGFLFVPINLASYVGMPTEKSSSVAGLVNFMRNIGSSVGTSMVTTVIARRAQFHQVHLVANVAPGQLSFSQAAEALTARIFASGVDAAGATRQAYAIIYRTVIVQATTLAYVDTYLVLAVMAATMFVLSFALRKNDPGARRVVVD
ncbi:MAG TPA: MFS transporter, partial [Terriglobales bacterium]